MTGYTEVWYSVVYYARFINNSALGIQDRVVLKRFLGDARSLKKAALNGVSFHGCL